MSDKLDISSEKRKRILDMTYDEIDCMSPGAADEWAEEVFQIDYDCDRDLKQKLKLHVTQFKGLNAKSYAKTRAQMSYKHILDEETKKREKLFNQLKNFEEAVKNLMNISHQYKNSIITKIQTMTQKFEEEKAEIMEDFLNVKPNPIFITGETSSGKSSFINLLLSDDIMPVDFERSSSTFCIITKSPSGSKKAKVYFKDPNREELIIEDSPDQQFNTECQKYLASRKNDIAHVELMTGSEILQDDIEIMDSPGMGDPEFAKTLKEKIRKACAFVYILKHFNPIGEDCQEIAEIVKNAIGGCREQIDYDSMVFIINKWDTVQRDKEATLEAICRRLNKFMGGLSNDRVIPMSVRDAIFMQKAGVRAEDYNAFLKLLHSLQISSITNKTRKVHALVVDYMTGILECLKLLEFKVNTRLEERKRKANELDQFRERINEELSDYMSKKKTQFDAAVEERTKSLLHRLKNDKEIRNSFSGLMSRWMPLAISQNDIDYQIAQFAAEKMSVILENQEQKDSYFWKISNDLLADFLQKFSEFEATLLQMQRDLFAGHKIGVLGKEKTLVERTIPDWSRLSTKQKIIFGVSIPVYIPIFIGACVVSLNLKFISTLKEALSSPPLLADIDTRRQYVLEKSLQLYDRYTKNKDFIRQYVKDNMKVVLDTLENLHKAAKEQVECLRIDAKVLREDGQSDHHLLDDAKLIKQRFHSYLSDLYQFEFECLQYERVLSENLFIYDDPKRPITSSTNSAIYGVTIVPEAMLDIKELKHDSNRACLKRIFWQVMSDDVQSLHTEINLSLKHHHSNDSQILRMVRVVKSPVNSENINVSLLSEPITSNLRDMVYERTACMESPAKFSFLFEMFSGLNNALTFLHSYKAVVGEKETYLTGFELNLDTIVVTTTGKVKLSNMKLPNALPLPKVVNCQDVVHGFRHIAPSVLLQKRPYDAAADMYSLAIAMYEAWFHTEAFLEFTFDRDNPKTTLHEFASQLTDPIEVLDKQVQRNGMNIVKAKGQVRGPHVWFDGIRKIIEAYNDEKSNLTAEFTSFLQEP